MKNMKIKRALFLFSALLALTFIFVLGTVSAYSYYYGYNDGYYSSTTVKSSPDYYYYKTVNRDPWSESVKVVKENYDYDYYYRPHYYTYRINSPGYYNGMYYSNYNYNSAYYNTAYKYWNEGYHPPQYVSYTRNSYW